MTAQALAENTQPRAGAGAGVFPLQTTIDADVHQGTLQDAQWYSYSANRTNSLLRTSKDKARAVKAALSHPRSAGMSDEAIADHVGVHRQTVLHFRHSLVDFRQVNASVQRTGKDGRTINTANIGKTKPAT